MEKKKFNNIEIDIGPYHCFIDEIIKLIINSNGGYICLANVHTIVESHFNPQVSEAIQHADIVAPDGMPLTWLLRLIHRVTQVRVPGMDLLPDLLKSCANNSIPVYFYGGTESLLRKTSKYLTEELASLKVVGMYSPPFRNLNEFERAEISTLINNSGAKLIFVILGCPKQELWMASMRNHSKIVMIGVGGALPVLVGINRRAPKFMQNWGLEWLYRFVQEPKRLGRRYLFSNIVFVFLLIKEKFQASFRTSHGV